eukprot:gene15597-biopygen13530
MAATAATAATASIKAAVAQPPTTKATTTTATVTKTASTTATTTAAATTATMTPAPATKVTTIAACAPAICISNSNISKFRNNDGAKGQQGQQHQRQQKNNGKDDGDENDTDGSDSCCNICKNRKGGKSWGRGISRSLLSRGQLQPTAVGSDRTIAGAVCIYPGVPTATSGGRVWRLGRRLTPQEVGRRSGSGGGTRNGRGSRYGGSDSRVSQRFGDLRGRGIGNSNADTPVLYPSGVRGDLWNAMIKCNRYLPRVTVRVIDGSGHATAGGSVGPGGAEAAATGLPRYPERIKFGWNKFGGAKVWWLISLVVQKVGGLPPPMLQRDPTGTVLPPPMLQRGPTGTVLPPPMLQRDPTGTVLPPPMLPKGPTGTVLPPPMLQRDPTGTVLPPPMLPKGSHGDRPSAPYAPKGSHADRPPAPYAPKGSHGDRPPAPYAPKGVPRGPSSRPLCSKGVPRGPSSRPLCCEAELRMRNTLSRPIPLREAYNLNLPPPLKLNPFRTFVPGEIKSLSKHPSDNWGSVLQESAIPTGVPHPAVGCATKAAEGGGGSRQFPPGCPTRPSGCPTPPSGAQQRRRRAAVLAHHSYRGAPLRRRVRHNDDRVRRWESTIPTGVPNPAVGCATKAAEGGRVSAPFLPGCPTPPLGAPERLPRAALGADHSYRGTWLPGYPPARPSGAPQWRLRAAVGADHSYRGAPPRRRVPQRRQGAEVWADHSYRGAPPRRRVRHNGDRGRRWESAIPTGEPH